MKPNRINPADRYVLRWFAPKLKSHGSLAIENAVEVDPSLDEMPDLSDTPGRDYYVDPISGDKVFMD